MSTSSAPASERERLAGRVANLHHRAVALAALRRFFDARGFLEIEAPLVVPSPGLELHLDAFPVDDRYLITSPEYQLKRLLAAGLPRIYSLCKCFRRGEAGAQHNPEFTMVEWYRAPGTWDVVARDVEELMFEVVAAIDPARAEAWRPPWRRLTVAEAVERWAGVRIDGGESAQLLAERGRAAGHHIPSTRTAWDDVFFSIFFAVEPRLMEAPTILHSWPAPLAALARLDADDPRVAERFEAYGGGLELANGFGELLDPAEQRARFEAEQAERRRRGLPVYPVDEKLLAALSHVPAPAAGVALGFDRLVMLACGASSIKDVLAFADDEL